jgi:arsenite/tail-anchored protein-transporting ATPase
VVPRVEGPPRRAPPGHRGGLRSLCRSCGPSSPSDELVGLDALRAFGEGLYGDVDPAAVLHVGEPLHIEARGTGYELSLELPFAERDDLEVGRRDDELLVRVGAHRRAIVLPDSLRRRPVGAASLRDGRLRVLFAGDATSADDVAEEHVRSGA